MNEFQEINSQNVIIRAWLIVYYTFYQKRYILILKRAIRVCQSIDLQPNEILNQKFFADLLVMRYGRSGWKIS